MLFQTFVKQFELARREADFWNIATKLNADLKKYLNSYFLKGF